MSTKHLTTLLLEVYHPTFKLEDFMASSPSTQSQHLPEKSYTCKDCGFTFTNATDFSNHFDRLIGNDGKPTLIIIGCEKLEVAN